MSDLWIIVCVICWFSLIESQTVYIVENETDWFTAFQTCKMRYGRLPGVNISDDRLLLQDLSGTINISSSFWIAATYDSLDINVWEPRYGYVYPYTCCETIANINGKQQFECGDCSISKDVICVTSNPDIYSELNIVEVDRLKAFQGWQGAFQECKTRNTNLPKRENAQLLEKATKIGGVFWLEEIRHINLNPDLGIQNRTCLHSFSGSIHEGSCYHTSITTVCIFDNETSSSKSNTYTPSVNTESSSKAGSFQTKTSETKHIVNTSKPTNYMQSQTITNGTIATSPSLYASFENSTNITPDEDRVMGIWPIIGGALGAFVVIIIVVIVIIILLRRRRTKNGHDTILNSTTNNKPTIKITPQTNLSHDTALGESFVLEAQIAISPQESTALEEEPVIYAQPKKVKTNSRNLMDDQFNITQTTAGKGDTGLYIIVQKEQKAHGISKNLDKDKGLGKGYYDISFMEPGKSEALDNLYNKANFRHPGCDEEQTVNVYDKANFRHEVLETDTGKGKFHRPESSNYDTTYKMNLTVDSTYDRLK